MFGIGLPELILIMGVALIVVGPEKLPELAKSLAKGINELKKTATALKSNIDEELKDAEDPWRQNLDSPYPSPPGVNAPETSGQPLIDGASPSDHQPPPEPAAKDSSPPRP